MTQRGRPRAFDREQALTEAMRLFWARGYEGTSIGDLAAVMGINRPSLYAAFGCKEALFREAIALYDALEGAPIQHLLDTSPTAQDAIEASLRHNAHAYASADKPHGCMIVLSSLLGTPENEAIRRLLAENRQQGETALRRRIERGIAEGDVPKTADAKTIAAFYATVTYGLAVQARDGASSAALARVVDAAMQAWPGLTGRG